MIYNVLIASIYNVKNHSRQPSGRNSEIVNLYKIVIIPNLLHTLMWYPGANGDGLIPGDVYHCFAEECCPVILIAVQDFPSIIRRMIRFSHPKAVWNSFSLTVKIYYNLVRDFKI